MATGDAQDIIQRIKGLVPSSWFRGDTPIYNTLLAGKADPLEWIYALYLYVLKQARIKTASGVWLDRISFDYFKTRLPRITGESDDAYRTRIIAELFRPRATRDAITRALTDLTGRAPQLMELWNLGDCGAYEIGTFAFDSAGAWGDLKANNQILVNAYRPTGEGIPGVGGYDNGAGGYDVGALEYIDMAWVTARVTDADIYACVAAIVAAGCTAWVAIESTPNTISVPGLVFDDVGNSQYLALV